MWRRDVRLPSDSKSPRPGSRRGLNSCDVEFMPVICPTFKFFARLSPARSYSNPWTGGAVFVLATVSGVLAAGGAAFMLATVSGALTAGGGLVLAAACSRVPRLD